MMSDKAGISVIILTYNEELNIKDCLESVKGLAEEILIVDSYSTDKTLEIVKKYTDKIYQHPFENQAKQFNWALENLEISGEWIMRLDADERVTQDLATELKEKLTSLAKDISGLYVRRKVYFMGRWISHGGYYPIWLLRIWRRGKAKIEERFMDEHTILLEGETARLKGHIIEKNNKGLSWWIEKHNSYATREAYDSINIMLKRQRGTTAIKSTFFGSQECRKRWLKENFYLRIPSFLRALLFFLYRYILRLGFLDGKEGLIFHFLQGFWYHFLIDAKIYEICKKVDSQR